MRTREAGEWTCTEASGSGKRTCGRTFAIVGVQMQTSALAQAKWAGANSWMGKLLKAGAVDTNANLVKR